MNSSRKTFQLAQYAVRRYSNAVKEVPSPKFQQMKKQQERFQLDDGLPIHLKGGLSDKLLYNFTVILTAVGLGMSFQTWYELARK